MTPNPPKRRRSKTPNDEYKRLVINHFKSGKATDEEWDEMANAVLVMSENGSYEVLSIDFALGVGPDGENI